MSKARLSGPPAIEPIAIPIDEYRHQTTANRGDNVQNAGQEPVSPLSPRSEAILARRQNSIRRVSPLNSPTKVRSTIRVQSSPRGSYPPANIRDYPPRKPVADSRPFRKGTVKAQNPIIVHADPHYSVSAEYAHASRPRSQSIQAVPDTFLQDYADHAAPQTRPSQRPRSQSVPSTSSQPAQQQLTERSTCAHCGRAQKNQRAQFITCPTCRGVFYCSYPCWDNRVCHRSVKCRICDCTQASSSTMDFKRCKKCLDQNKEFWYCSEECFERRNCHVREDQMQPPRVPAKGQAYAYQQMSQGQRRLGGTVAAIQLQHERDVEAQRAKGTRKPLSQRTRVSGTVWAAGITAVLLLIFVPIIIVVGKNPH